MDITFITIHDLTDDAHILYSSDSIVDILGYTPDEVVNRPAWQFFHPDELPLAKAKHSRGVRLDKAAVLSYCRLKNRQGDWVGCECCFSVVYDVMVVCTSVYRDGMKSQKRAVQAPVVRKLFASSPKDPRYHMLSHLSSKFDLGSEQQTHEPRAALFLNRFTRTMTVMYATSGLEQIIGVSGENMKARSFYSIISDNCIPEALQCLERAKSNDSIAYMRFIFEDRLRVQEYESGTSESEDDQMTDVTGSDYDESENGVDNHEQPTSRSVLHHAHANSEEPPTGHRNDSGDSGNPTDRHSSLIGERAASRSSDSSRFSSPHSGRQNGLIELEAVVSCTSDGLVVCLRRARQALPGIMPNTQSAQYNGVFAAPWATEPVFHPPPPQYPPYPLGAQHPHMLQHEQQQSVPSQQFQDAFMQSIRDVAVFAWALTGINGSLASYARGNPTGQSQPPSGLAVWNPLPDPNQFSNGKQQSAAPSGYVSGSNSSSSNDPFGFGDPGR